MRPVILTLQVPDGARGIPVATTADRELLQEFKRVLKELDPEEEMACIMLVTSFVRVALGMASPGEVLP